MTEKKIDALIDMYNDAHHATQTKLNFYMLISIMIENDIDFVMQDSMYEDLLEEIALDKEDERLMNDAIEKLNDEE